MPPNLLNFLELPRLARVLDELKWCYGTEICRDPALGESDMEVVNSRFIDWILKNGQALRDECEWNAVKASSAKPPYLQL